MARGRCGPRGEQRRSKPVYRSSWPLTFEEEKNRLALSTWERQYSGSHRDPTCNARAVRLLLALPTRTPLLLLRAPQSQFGARSLSLREGGSPRPPRVGVAQRNTDSGCGSGAAREATPGGWQPDLEPAGSSGL
eukprot:997518-Rhodomonas_salina.2